MEGRALCDYIFKWLGATLLWGIQALHRRQGQERRGIDKSIITLKSGEYLQFKLFLIIMRTARLLSFSYSVLFDDKQILSSYPLIFADNEYWEMIFSRTMCYI